MSDFVTPAIQTDKRNNVDVNETGARHAATKRDGFSSRGEAAPSRTIYNPYKRKRSRPPIYKEPLEPVTTQDKQDQEQQQQQQQQDYNSETILSKSLSTIDSVPSSSVCSDEENAKNGIDEKCTSSSTSGGGTSSQSLSFQDAPVDEVETDVGRRAISTDLPYWKRLQSLNLSFGSAEILTVSECCQRCSHPPFVAATNDNNDNKIIHHPCSVRVSGIVKERIVHTEYNRISLLLADPVAGSICSSHKTSTTTATTIKNTRGSLLKRRRTGSLLRHQPHNSNNNNGVRTPPSSVRLVSRPRQQRRISSVAGLSRPKTSPPPPAPTTPSTSTTKDSSHEVQKPQQEHQKQKQEDLTSESATKTQEKNETSDEKGVNNLVTTRAAQSDTTCPVKTLGAIQRRLNSESLLWIVANPTNVSVQLCAVGDLVMVIGELRHLSSTLTFNDWDSPAPPFCGSGPTGEATHPCESSFTADAAPDERKHPHQQLRCCVVLVPRIVQRLPPTTDMKLYQDALLARRSYLQQIVQSQQCPLSLTTTK